MESQHMGTLLETEPQAQGAGDRPLEGTEVDALYEASLLHFQEGRWQEAEAGFQQVLQLCPDHAGAKTFLEETRVKASLDQHAPRPRRFRFQGATRYVVWTLLVLLVGMFLVVGGRWAYERWVRPVKALQQEERAKAQQLEQAYKYLAERDYAAAEEAFRALLATDPDNAEAQAGLAEVQKKASLAQSYAQVQQAIAHEDWDEAARRLAAIIALDPGYRDVQAQQAFVQEQQQLSTWFKQAEAAYAAHNWQEAITAYETLRGQNVEYQKATVEEHLFDAYLKQGIHWVDSSKGQSESVRKAKGLYQKALALRPQQLDAMQEIAMADKYLEGQSLLAQGDTAGAIAALEWVYKQKPSYADGNAATLLQAAGGQVVPPASASTAPTPPAGTSVSSFQEQYANAMQRGDAALAAQDYAQAEQEYRQAIAIGVHGGYNSARWLFAAYAKAGTAAARKGDYDVAVEQVKTAIRIITQSATAVPSESYASLVAQGDQYAEQKDYPRALEQYSQALRVLSLKCNCGLEQWSILP